MNYEFSLQTLFNVMINLDNVASPSLLRRLAAMFYDGWLLVALWLIGVTFDYFLRRAIGIDAQGADPLLRAYMAVCPFAFFGWFWTHGGQTLGMRAWRLLLVDADGGPIGWRQAMIRVAAAHLSLLLAGLGYLWILVDRDRLAWHDRLSRSRLVITRRS
ncbi:MAG: RDD family protein [Chromatiaceae bacterium]|nr:RDD family protein [Chromatiaceae bacterium]